MHAAGFSLWTWRGWQDLKSQKQKFRNSENPISTSDPMYVEYVVKHLQENITLDLI